MWRASGKFDRGSRCPRGEGGIMTKNEKSFLDMIAWAEFGPEIISKSDNGYNVLVGSRPIWC